MMDDFNDDFIVDDELLTEALVNEPAETDEEQSARLKTVIEKCSDGPELYQFIVEKLPVCGQKFGSSLSMNRALTALKVAKLIDDKHPTWASCKKSQKDAVELVFGGLLAGSSTFISLKTSVLEGFVVKKIQGKVMKARVHQTLILEDQADSTNLSGRSVDRIALLACALVDPELNHMFTTLASPVDAAVRPAFFVRKRRRVLTQETNLPLTVLLSSDDMVAFARVEHSVNTFLRTDRRITLLAFF